MLMLFEIEIRGVRSISLDPDEDKRDATIFDGLKRYMISEMSADECEHFKTVTLRNLAKRAQSLKSLRPPRGLSFSLQQQRKYRTAAPSANSIKTTSLRLRRIPFFIRSFYLFFQTANRTVMHSMIFVLFFCLFSLNPLL